MVRRKSIRWALALLIIFAVVATVIYRIERNKQKALIELAKKKGKGRSMPVEKPPSAPPPKKVPKVTVLGPVAKEHLAEKSFISELRAVFLWRSSQPKSPETNRILLEKLAAIAFEDLPPERRNAWQSLLQAWNALDDPNRKADPQIEAEGRKAAETLNAMLKAHGDGDLAF